MSKSLDQLLDEVDYSFLNSTDYVPSEFALGFMNFIKLVNGDSPEPNKTPPFHLAMLDKIASRSQYVANLCFRGSGKTTVFAEYMFLYLAVFQDLPGVGKLDSMIYVSDSVDNGVKSFRKNVEFRYRNSEFLMKVLPEVSFTDNYIQAINQDGKMFAVKSFGATTGIRGTKIFGKRPKFALLDDLLSDEAAKSKVVMQLINDTVYKGINHALDPVTRKVVFNGTPFAKNDILVEAVESGEWEVNCWPVCEKFPVEKEDFRGAWEDRFSYEFIKKQYEMSVGTGKQAAFYQELMLRISSEDERLVQDDEIRWYSRIDLLEHKEQFNFYITTDFATSSKQTSDDSVISVWAYNNNGDFFWVDGICEKQTMDKNVDDLFRLVLEYKPLSVGIEITGQQGGFIPWFQEQMMTRNIWFTFASNQKGNTPGIRPVLDKLSRFQMVVPWFKAGKIYFPKEMQTTSIMGTFMSEIKLTTKSGIKGHDDCIDTISMLGAISLWKPDSAPNLVNSRGEPIWEEEYREPTYGMDSYIV